MQFYIIAGENSGDLIGARLINHLRSKAVGDLGEFEFFGIGGNRMKEAGQDSLFSMDEINMMGFFEILPHIFRINKLIDQTVEDIIVKNPKIVVTIDSPGFTFRVAKRLRELAPHIKLLHIVAPSVWAYKPGRAKKYAKIYDKLLTLLPFEPHYFTMHGLSSICIGHPALEQEFYSDSKELRAELDITDEHKVIAITPGSRRGEIMRHMPIISQVLDELATTHKIKAVFVQPDESNVSVISKFLENSKFDYIFSTDRLKAFAAADCALAKSGTNTLEIAASGTAMIVGYKLHPVTFFAIKMMLRIKYASLINIIANREIIPEYIQSDFNAENVTHALSELLNDKDRARNQVIKSQQVLESIGFNSEKKASESAAKIILGMCD